MPKIDLTGRINGDFVVIGEYEPIVDSKGKKQLRWLCECQTCKEKEVVLGTSIRRNRHRCCSYCLIINSNDSPRMEERVEEISQLSVSAGHEPITVKQFIKACKYREGLLPNEEVATLPKVLVETIHMF